MFVSVKSVSKSSNVCGGLFVGLSLIPELILIGINCASYFHRFSNDYDQHRLVIWNLSLACVIFLFKAIQLPLLFICSANYRPGYLFPILVLWFLLNLGNVILGIMICIHFNKENSLREQLFIATIALLSIILAFMLLVCFSMIGRIGWVIHRDDNRL
jgi:hypothetical protein